MKRQGSGRHSTSGRMNTSLNLLIFGLEELLTQGRTYTSRRMTHSP